MLVRAAALVLVVLAACSASPKQVCSASVSARAEGRYRGQTPEAAKAADRRTTYACLTACYDFYDTDMKADDIYGHPLCLEAYLLKAAALPREGVPKVRERCERGVTAACAGLEANPAPDT